MEAIHDTDTDTLQVPTRRYQRERGFTRGVFVVVPDWQNIDRYHVPDWYDDALEHASVAENIVATLTLNA